MLKRPGNLTGRDKDHEKLMFRIPENDSSWQFTHSGCGIKVARMSPGDS